MKKVAVILSGCGRLDGAEISESILTLLAIDKHGAKYQCLAPNISQHHVINHLTQQEEPEQKRNVLEEAARIARGDVIDLAKANPQDYDALILPGGFGAAKNLREFAFKGPGGSVNDQVKRILEEMIDAGKVIGALCIAPATVGMALKDKAPKMTVGKEEGVIGALASIGVNHQLCGVDEIAVDEANKIVTTPAYMLGPGIKDVAVGIEKLVTKVLSMA